jgi:multisubunit Na+/H+ antiporter MnhG subunit
MAVWVWTLREPIRGLSEGIKTAQTHPNPFREFWKEFACVVPPMTLWSLHRAGAGAKGVGKNILAAMLISVIAYGLIRVFGDPEQWIALGIGVYAFVSWVQNLSLRDHPTFAMIFGSKALIFSIIGFSTLAFSGYALGFWGPTFFQRMHGVSAAETGTVLGLTAAIGGWIGITSGGVLSDRLKKVTPKARIWIGVVTVLTNTPCVIGMLMTSNVYVAYVLNIGNQLTASFWVGTVVAVANELVLPRMRATSSAFYILTVTFIGLALGPYTVGKISDVFVAGGSDSGTALKYALMISLSTFIVSIVCFIIAGRHIEEDEKTRIERARAAGEPGL